MLWQHYSTGITCCIMILAVLIWGRMLSQSLQTPSQASSLGLWCRDLHLSYTMLAKMLRRRGASDVFTCQQTLASCTRQNSSIGHTHRGNPTKAKAVAICHTVQ